VKDPKGINEGVGEIILRNLTFKGIGKDPKGINQGSN
jgi:hypothetical protein